MLDVEYLRKRDVIFYQFFRDLSKKEQQIFWDDLGVGIARPGIFLNVNLLHMI